MGKQRRKTDWTPPLREPDASQADVEQAHRLHDDPPPIERGAIDRNNSVGGSRGRGKAQPPRP